MAKAKKSTNPARNLSTFKAVHDPAVRVPTAIRTALATLRTESGDDAYVYEHKNPSSDNALPTLSALSGIGSAIISEYAAQFKDFWVVIPDNAGRKDGRRVWFATAKAATLARAIAVK